MGPRVGLVPAADVLLFDGNPPGGACGRVSDAAWRLTSGNLAKEILLFILFYVLDIMRPNCVTSAKCFALFDVDQHASNLHRARPSTPKPASEHSPVGCRAWYQLIQVRKERWVEKPVS